MSRPVLELEPMFRLNTISKRATRWEPSALEDIGVWERTGLQQWLVEELRDESRLPEQFGILESVVGAPTVTEQHTLGGPLLLISEEFSGWAHGGSKHSDRLDLLLLDADANPVVVELKRGVADEYADFQALRYAAYVSTLTPGDIESMLSKRLGVDVSEARRVVADHVALAVSPTAGLDDLGQVRMVVVAEGFTAPMTTTAMFLRDRKIDVRCLQLSVRVLDDEELAISPRLLVPPPTADAFLVKRQEQEQAEATARETKQRRARTVDILVEHETITPGTELRFATSTLGPKRRPAVERWFAEDPSREVAVWTGERGGRALRWKADGELYSPSLLAQTILGGALGSAPDAVPGPDYWFAPGSTTMLIAQLADQVLERS